MSPYLATCCVSLVGGVHVHVMVTCCASVVGGCVSPYLPTCCVEGCVCAVSHYLATCCASSNVVRVMFAVLILSAKKSSRALVCNKNLCTCCTCIFAFPNLFIVNKSNEGHHTRHLSCPLHVPPEVLSSVWQDS